uniref:Uncharacterized protein n=1 Tax=Panagrolaimus sp. ES5 TaxID=591445 RepID=A0AC34FEC0_9BILA
MIRQTEKYTEMPLDNRGQVTQTYRVDSFESGRLPNGRLPGGILKSRPYDYSNTNSSNSMSISGPNSQNSVRQPFIPQSTFPTVSQNNYPPKYDANGYNLSPGGGMVNFEPPYRPTIENSEASFNSKKTFDKLEDVYSDSGDTVEFATNLRKFLDENIPSFVWILFLLVQIIVGFTCLFIGTFNFPYCAVQPMIPVYLIASGCLLIINSVVRMFGYFPSSRSGDNQRRTNKKANLMSNLCFYGIEGIILLAIIINLILGCVWVYGSRWRVHFEEGMYEEHFCEWTLYWFSWWSVTMHLATFGLLIVAVIFILIYGSMS